MAEDKKISENKLVHDGAEVTNWISQINTGNVVYDIATHHGITFKNGGTDTEGVTWNGITDLEIVIPNIADLIQDPIKFIGTVDSTNVNDYTSGSKGDLVFITGSCEFAGVACEAGDMAIYDGSNWKVVSGENQVKITGNTNSQITETNRTTVTIKGTETDVLEVEGKALSLKLDYSDIVNNLDLDKESGGTESVQNGKVTVGSVSLKLNGTPSSNIATTKNFVLPTALSDGTVTFTNATDDTFVTGITGGVLSGGKMPELLTNNEEKTFNLGGNLTKDSTLKHFVESVSFTKLDKEEEGAVKLHGDLTPGSGTEFVTGVNGNDTFTVSYIKPTDGLDAEFIKYVEGSYVTSVTEGTFKIGENGTTKVAVGFGAESVTSGDVVSNVEVITTKDTSVLSSAYVTEGTHVLCFGSEKVIDTVTAKPKYKSLATETVTYTPTTVGTASFTSGGFTTDSSNVFTLNKTAETTYTQDSEWYKLTQDKSGYNVSGAHAIVPKETYGVGLSESSFPTMSAIVPERKGSLAATVSTSLTGSTEAWHTLNSDSVTFNEYTLGVADDGNGDVTVGASGTVNVNGATVDLSTYKKDVNIIVKS